MDVLFASAGLGMMNNLFANNTHRNSISLCLCKSTDPLPDADVLAHPIVCTGQLQLIVVFEK
jgi:hypothetical protein